MSQDQFTIEELSAASGVPSRTIRYYQSEGYLPGPKRLARRAIYSREHLERLQRIVAERSIKTLSEIKSDHADEEAIESGRSPRPAASRFEEIVRFVVRDGIEVLVAPDRADLSGEVMQRFFSEISVLANEIGKEREESRLALAPASPEGSACMLDALVTLGFTEEAFRIVHPKPNETIRRHRQYVESISAFKPSSQNVLVNHRLQLCVRFAEAVNGEIDWIFIADRAAQAVPLLGAR